jgi:c(7)-type cytochrome triheme protein
MSFGVHCNQCHDVKGHQKPLVHLEVCSGCHDVKSFTYPAQGLTVAFSHSSHSERYACSRCHPEPFRMKKGTTGITMERLYKGDLCGSCHNGKEAFSSKDCTRCHDMKAFKKPVKYPGGGMQAVVFSHELHASMFGCKECHDRLFKMKASPGKMTMAEMYQGKLCGACHNGQMAFASTDCQKCHK